MAGRALLSAETGGVSGAWTTLEPGVWKVVIDTDDASVLNIEARNASTANEHTLVDGSATTVALSNSNPEHLYTAHDDCQVRVVFATDDGGPVTVYAHMVEKRDW